MKNCFLKLLSCLVNIIAGEYPNISKQYTMVKYHFSMYRENILNVKSTLQKVLACWATYVENLRLLKACFEETKKEQMKEVFSVLWHLLNFNFFFFVLFGYPRFQPKNERPRMSKQLLEKFSKVLERVQVLSPIIAKRSFPPYCRFYIHTQNFIEVQPTYTV